MKLKTYEIKSYRSCTKSKVDINEELTTLIGVNGSGKSNLLNAILLLKKVVSDRRKYYYTIQPENQRKYSFEATIEYMRKDIRLKGNIYYLEEEDSDAQIVRTDIKWDFSQITGIKEWINAPFEISDFYDYRDDSRHSHLGSMYILNNSFNKVDETKIKKNIQYIRAVKNFFKGIKYYSASQFADPLECPTYIELDDDIRLRGHYSASNHERFIFDLYKLFQENKNKFTLYLDIVNKNGIGLIDYIDFKAYPTPSTTHKVYSGGKVKNIERKRKLVIPLFNIDGSILSPNQLSEGTLRALALIFYILTDESTILLIEEPEMGVHYGLLNSIISLIVSQAKSKQIVMSTHSDDILDQLKPESIVLVTRKPQRGTLAKSLTSSLTKNDFKALRKYLNEYGNLGEYWKEGGFDTDNGKQE